MKRVIVKYAFNMTPDEVRRCKQLSFKKSGALTTWLDQALEWEDSKVVLYKVDGAVIGWCLRKPDGLSGTFVAPKYRRQGYGTKIIKRAEKLGPLTVFPHDQAGNKLFAKVKCKIV